MSRIIAAIATQTRMTSNAKYKILIFSTYLFCACIPLLSSPGIASMTICLNGIWDMGHARKYVKQVVVPGIHTDASVMNTETLWYRKEIILPSGKWNHATLELKGARFAPEVFINGISVSRQNGGMAPTFHLLNQKDVKPGKKIVIEIALTSLKDLPVTDASYIPVADHWRSNISSCLWDDVILRFHGDLLIDRIIPFTYFDEKNTEFTLRSFIVRIEAGSGKEHYRNYW